MTQEHPITPTPELIRKWNEKAANAPMADQRYIATQAARWGADQELEACCVWLRGNDPYEHDYHQMLRAARRPKPPSLKEQALQALYRFDDTEGHDGLTQEQIAEDFVLIRRALESLPE